MKTMIEHSERAFHYPAILGEQRIHKLTKSVKLRTSSCRTGQRTQRRSNFPEREKNVKHDEENHRYFFVLKVKSTTKPPGVDRYLLPRISSYSLRKEIQLFVFLPQTQLHKTELTSYRRATS